MATSRKDSGYVDNWQAGKTVTECNLHMLTTEDCSDVIFRVGSDKHVVRAHRYVLVSRSCVFHAMFCGPLAEKGEVTIPEIEFKDFNEFLWFVYADTVNITAENVTGLLYTSRKYAVDALFDQCAAFLEKSLTEDNVCQILEQCHGYGELDLEQKALKILTEAGEKVTKSPGFLDLCSSCFNNFLKSDELSLKEEDIYEATLFWAYRQCENESIRPTPQTLRNVLGKMIYEIRFSSMSQDYLVKVVGPTKILTAEERVGILDQTFGSSVDISPFKSSPRKNSVKIVSRFGRVATSWDCAGGQDAISFSASKDIQLLGCQMYGSWRLKESTFKLNITLYDDLSAIIAEPVTKSDWRLQGLRTVNNIMFSNPVPLVARRTYTLCASMIGDNTNFGRYGEEFVKVDEVEFFFKNSPKSTPGWTTTLDGQIPGLIWR